MKEKTIKLIFWIGCAVLLCVFLCTAIYCGITACSFVYGLKVFFNLFIAVVGTVAVAQVLAIPYYFMRIMEMLQDIRDNQDNIIVNVQTLKSFVKQK